MTTGASFQATKMANCNQAIKGKEGVRPTRMLLLNFNPGRGLGNRLQEILKSLPVESELRQVTFASNEIESSQSQVALIISSFSPALLFINLSRDALKHPQVLIQSLKSFFIPIVVIVEAAEPQELFELLNHGVFDFFTSPLKALDILPRVWRMLRHTSSEQLWMRRIKEKLGLERIIGDSSSFLGALNVVPMVAECDASVLISGETGTGKELVARAIHYLSSRADHSFIPVNCGAIPHDLVENELFGHERGAYTGASNSRTGLIREADGGTLFLDEIDSLPWLAQVKFLRFLQEKEYRPLGTTKLCRADVRIIAASNINCEEAVRKGNLRQDLYYRLNVIPIALPALRDRQEDIPLLAHHFLVKHAARFRKHVLGFSQQAMQMFLLYEWPGNVRELEHVVERAIVLSEGHIIGHNQILLPIAEKSANQASFQELKSSVVSQFERAYIKSLLLVNGGNINKAAQAAQKNRRAFWQLMRKHNIQAREFRG
jgi:two-component system, NtrC family, response regulator GlrR